MIKKLHKGNCINCGKAFSSRSHRKLSCVTSCYSEWYKKNRADKFKISKKCKICKNDFLSHRCLKTKYCSHRCKGVAFSRIKHESRRIVQNCKYCDKKFSFDPYWKGKKFYCSRACHHADNRKIVNCCVCEKPMLIPKRGDKRCCSKKCVSKVKIYNRSIAEIELDKAISKEFKTSRLPMKIGKRMVFPDIAVGNKIIEFNGDFFHCNPRKYSANYFNKITRKTAKEKWEKDKKRIKSIRNKGYNVKVIWEYDYLKNPDRVIDRCLKFLRKKG